MMLRTVWLGCAIVVLALAPRFASAQSAEEQHRRLRCAVLSGGDLSEPGALAAFKRCLASGPAPEGPGNAPPAPAVNPLGNLVTQTPVTLVNPPPSDRCQQGLVWREATPGDHLCVTPDERRRAAEARGGNGGR